MMESNLEMINEISNYVNTRNDLNPFKLHMRYHLIILI